MIEGPHSQWLQNRGIPSDLAARLGITAGSKGEAQWLSIPYRLDGQIVNRKHRRIDEKQHSMDKGGKLCLWNAEVLTGVGEVIITEGEFDALAVMAAGFERVVSVPNGAPAERIDDPVNANRYSFLWEHEAALKGIESFVLATDGDKPGRALAHDLAAILGPERCKFIEYPEGCKDLNEVLVSHGEREVVRLIVEAKPFPVAGIYSMSDFPEAQELRAMDTGIEALDPLMSLVLGSFTVFSGYSNMGKALALDTPIATPTGWSSMGDMRIGDELFAADGTVCRVIAATDIQHNRPCYAVKFRDGETIIADENHLWLTDTVASKMSAAHRARRGEGPLKAKGSDPQHKRTFASVKTTGEIASTMTAYGRRNHSISVAKPLVLRDADLPLDPYLLGAWLGDGSTFGGVITSADADIPTAFSDAGFPVTSKGYRHNIRLLVVRLREAGVFGNKHVPTIYKRASYAQRLAIVQGLMDTDGHCDKLGNCEFVSTNEILARDMFELVASLGVKVSIVAGRATLKGKDCGTKFRVRFCTSLPVFRLERKLERLPVKTTTRCDRFIMSCDPVESVPVRCIQIDHPSQLFLAGRSMVPTHNSTVMNTIVAHCLSRNVPVCIASFETAPKPILRDGIARAMIGCSFDQFPRHPERQAAYEVIEKRLSVISNAMDDDTDIDLEQYLELCRVAVVRHGAKLIILDPWNEIEHKRGRDETETDYIGRAIRALKRFARRYNVALWVVAHPTKPQGKSGPPGLYDIAGSANWANKADYGLIYHRPDKTVNQGTLSVVKVRMGFPGGCDVVDVKMDEGTSRIVGV